MIGETPPSSAVIGFFSSGRFSRRRRFVAAAALALRRTPDDGVERGGRPGDVHVHEPRMPGEIRADRRAAADDAQQARLDERCERALVHRDQGILRGVHLEQGRAVVGEELVQHVEHRDGGDVARAQDESDAARFTGGALCEAGRCPRGARRDSRLQPDLAREPRQQELVDAGQGECVHAGASTGCAVDRDAVERVGSGCESREGLDVGVERAEHAVRSAEPFLAAQRMPGVEALRRRGGVRPVLCRGGDARADRTQQRHPLRDRER
ncbi:hypothetical protein [Microbacterium sp. Se5.02b]|uniref:hypothetical protein n=1 Tax=Microbacterium sp. Se5.02b TaxID=2864103 RepID=UPI00215D753C|nr:hypothetical protein [Microbacterium sp. Se5.02b]